VADTSREAATSSAIKHLNAAVRTAWARNEAATMAHMTTAMNLLKTAGWKFGE